MLKSTNISNYGYTGSSPFRGSGDEVVAGNIITVFSDRKKAQDIDANGVIDSYKGVLLASNDYTPFGMQMANRGLNASIGEYRFGYNGQEKDDEIKGTGNSLNFGARIYDPRIGRFFSVDPLFYESPNWSPFVFAFDNPINLIDEDGLSGKNPREKFYSEYATPLIKKMDDVTTANKYKALYIVAQKRTENGFKLNPKGNIYNIKGKGDKGSVKISATEYDKNGKAYKKTDSYAVYSSNDKASEAYLSLVQNSSYYKDSWSALTDDKKTFDDFSAGMKKYATAPNYKEKLKENFACVVKDYENYLNKQISDNEKTISSNNAGLQSMVLTDKGRDDFMQENASLEAKNADLQSELSKLQEFKNNENIK